MVSVGIPIHVRWYLFNEQMTRSGWFQQMFLKYWCIYVAPSLWNNIFSCDKAVLSTLLSVRPSVRLWHLFHNVPVIVSSWNFITIDKSDVHAKRQGQSSKVKVIEVKSNLTVSGLASVWIHIWWWYNAQGLTLLRRGVILFFKVIRQISRSRGTKNCRF